MGVNLIVTVINKAKADPYEPTFELGFSIYVSIYALLKSKIILIQNGSVVKSE